MKTGGVETRVRHLPAGHCVDVGSAHWVGDVAQELHGPGQDVGTDHQAGYASGSGVYVGFL